jgi:hypothetical protein
VNASPTHAFGFPSIEFAFASRPPHFFTEVYLPAHITEFFLRSPTASFLQKENDRVIVLPSGSYAARSGFCIHTARVSCGNHSPVEEE